MTKAKSGAKRLAEHRKAKRDAGLIPKEIWVHPSAWPAVKACIAAKNDEVHRPADRSKT